MKDNIDEVIKKKYIDIKVPEIQLDKLETRKSYNGYKIAVIVLAVVVVVVATIITNKYGRDMENNPTGNIVAENSNDVLKTPEIVYIGTSSDIMSIASMKIDYVVKIKVNKILGYTNYSEIQNKYTFPITKLEVTVQKSLRGKISGTIEINKSGGIISMAEWEKTLTEEQKEKKGYNDMTQEEKENTFLNIVTTANIDMSNIKEGNTYLAFLKRDDKVYNGLSVASFMVEYDENSDSIKVNGAWEPVKENKFVKKALEIN